MVSFALYFVYVVLSYIRIFDAFAPWMEVYRPIAVLGLIAFAAALWSRVLGNPIAARPVQLGLIAALFLWVGISVAATG